MFCEELKRIITLTVVQNDQIKSEEIDDEKNANFKTIIQQITKAYIMVQINDGTVV